MKMAAVTVMQKAVGLAMEMRAVRAVAMAAMLVLVEEAMPGRRR